MDVAGSCTLVVNAGSSSFKAALFPSQGDTAVLTGHVDRIGQDGTLTIRDATGDLIDEFAGNLTSHDDALAALIAAIRGQLPELRLAAIGHRVVHGGLDFTGPVVVTPDVLDALAKLCPFAPLHQPHNLAGIRAAAALFPEAIQVACFDTAFHRGHPFVNDTFAIPHRYYEQGVRRYGFHGISYEYVTSELARIAPQLTAKRVVVAHLGNGASMCAVRNGRSVASSMGFSTLDGLPMGTRCGGIDPGVLLYMLEREDLDGAQIRQILYNESGLLGLSGGLSHDMRELERSGDPAAARAIDYFVFRVQREFGAMAAAMGGLDAIVFCGGIGENSAEVRRRVCEPLGWMGVEINDACNARAAPVLSPASAHVRVMIVPTREDIVIARAARAMTETGDPAVPTGPIDVAMEKTR